MKKYKTKKDNNNNDLSLDEYVSRGFSGDESKASCPAPNPIKNSHVIEILMEEIDKSLFFMSPKMFFPDLGDMHTKDNICGVVSVLRNVTIKKHSGSYHKYEKSADEYLAKFVVIKFVDPSTIWNEIDGCIDCDELIKIAERTREAKKFWDKFGAIYIVHSDIDYIVDELKSRLGVA